MSFVVEMIKYIKVPKPRYTLLQKNAFSDHLTNRENTPCGIYGSRFPCASNFRRI